MENRLEIHHADILHFDADKLQFHDHLQKDWHDDPPSLNIVGNLPFNVSTPRIVQWLRSISTRSDFWKYGRVPLTLTFQREVAERIVAKPRGPQRCRLSLACQYLCEVTYQHTIPGSCFVPPPKVDAGVVTFVPRIEPLIQGVPFDVANKVFRHVFHYRQKHIKYGIRSVAFSSSNP